MSKITTDVTVDDKNMTIYNFNKLNEEKEALNKYRTAIQGAPALGEIVFDSDTGSLKVIEE
jgi:heme oxygenase